MHGYNTYNACQDSFIEEMMRNILYIGRPTNLSIYSGLILDSALYCECEKRLTDNSCISHFRLHSKFSTLLFRAMEKTVFTS